MANFYFRGPTSPGTVATTASNVIANWSTTDNGTNDQVAVPASGDNVFLTVNSGGIVITGTTSWGSLNCTGYIRTLSGSSALSLNLNSGALLFSSTMTITATSTLTINANPFSFTFNGQKWTGTMALSTSIVVTMQDDGIVQHLSSVGSSIKTLNGVGRTMYVNGNFTMTIDLQGTAGIYLNTVTTGTYSGTGILSNNITFNPTGNLTISGSNNVTGIKITVLNTNGGVINNTGTVIHSTSAATLTLESYTNYVWNNISLTGNFATNLTLNNNIRCNNFALGGTVSKLINGFTVYCNSLGGVNGGTVAGGTTNFIMDGTGTYTGAAATYVMNNNVTVDTSGDITLATTLAIGTGCTFRIIRANSIIIGGTVTLILAGGNFYFKDAFPSLTFAGIFFNSTTTDSFFDGDLYGTGFTISSGTTKALNGGNVFSSGNVTNSAVGNGLFILNLIGTGTISGSSQQNYNIIIDTNGTYTLISSITPGSLLRVKKGTIVSTGFNLVPGNGSQIDTAIVTWDNISHVTGASVITLLSTLFANKWIVSNNPVTFLGTYGIDVNQAIWTTLTGIQAISLSPGNIYRIRSIFDSSTTYVKNRYIQSTIPGTKAKLTLDVGATCNIGYWNFTDIDASGGRPINTFAGIVSNCLNVNSYIDPYRAISRSFAG